MPETVKIALIVAIPPTLAAVASLIASLRNKQKLDGLHVDLNSRLTELIRTSGLKERAEGYAEGQQQAEKTAQK